VAKAIPRDQYRRSDQDRSHFGTPSTGAGLPKFSQQRKGRPPCRERPTDWKGVARWPPRATGVGDFRTLGAALCVWLVANNKIQAWDLYAILFALVLTVAVSIVIMWR
jgi:hypothetical protein